ncbi:MAG: hypothetical protein JSS68_05825 [Actinobacteria bacterium]|nr:hypothetical protein [Actinomycetota bacterium]
MPELLIRSGANDHEVVRDLLAPGAGSVLLPRARPLIDRLVLDAHVAAARPELAESARDAGVPVLVDPLTIYLQGELREADRWSRLPFGEARKLDAAELANPFYVQKLVAEVVEFEVGQGATAIVPPYPYVTSPDDPHLDIAIAMLRATSRHMARNGIALPLVPVLCAQLQRMGPEKSWREGLDRFAAVALDLGPEALAVCLSPAGSPRTDSYNKVLRLFAATRRLKQSGVRVFAWRQGFYGPGLVAAGIDGYETGIGTKEQANLASAIGSRKPGKKGGGSGPGIYLEPFGRSVTSRVGETLLGHRSMRPKVMCDDERCCPNGAASTIDQRRHHAVRTRSRQLATIENQPHTRWRLHQVEKESRAAVDLAVQANAVLKEAKVPEQIGTRGYEALAGVMDFFLASMEEARAA